ncbi:MAG TPA: radical SAM protein [Candidatus Omnitrophota bacterium]|nr:radical SAM protein [Candidatus Omnitrophota bacterium]HPS21183.1 radical SAM protein [Candidatus Omnitrophota bacterium]
MNKEILLIQPWIEDFYITDCRLQPIGLCYIAANVMKEFPDMPVHILDCLSSSHKENLPWPTEFKYLKPYYGHPDSGPFALFHKYYRFGMPEQDVRCKLERHSPLVIGISSLFTPYYRETLAMASLCKDIFPDVPIVIGGNHASLHPGSLLHYKNKKNRHVCNYVVRGEGEIPFRDIISSLLAKKDIPTIPNIIKREDTHSSLKPVEIPDRDKIPSPAISILDINKYTYKKLPSAVLVTSRSCPHKCAFCTVHAVFGERYYTVPEDRVISEIKDLFSLGIRHFDIEDDNFTFDRQRAIGILDKIIELDLPIELSAMNGLSYLSLDNELLTKMKKAGFKSINLAIVSHDEKIRAGLARPHTRDRLIEIVSAANSIGLTVGISCIIGLPDQTIPEIWSTLTFLSGLQCLIQPSPFYFTPGSRLHIAKQGDPGIKLASHRKDPFLSARLTAMDLECNEFTREDIFTLWKLVRVINHIKMGLDKGHAENSPFFSEAFEIFKTCKWRTSKKYGGKSLPFSQKVASLIKTAPLRITGHKTNNTLFVR